MAWLGASAGLGTCANAGWLMGVKVWPKATEPPPNTCFPTPALPEEAAVLLLTGGAVCAL